MNPLAKLRLAAKAVREAIPSQSLLPPESREGERLLEAGKFAEAEECLRGLLRNAELPRGLRPYHAHTFVCLAKAQLELHKLVDARVSAERALEALGGERAKPCTDLAAAQQVLGRIWQEAGDLAQAGEILRTALETQESASPVDVPAIVERSLHLAQVLEEMEELDEAHQVLEKAHERAEKTLGDSHAVTANCLIELGQCESARGNHEAAHQHLKRALEIHCEMHGFSGEVVIRDLQLIAAASQAAEDFQTAAEYYERALSMRERQLGGAARESAEIMMNLAGVESEMGRFGRAAELLQQAVSKLEVERQANVGEALEKLGVVYMLSGRFRDADSSIARARRFYELNPERYRHAIKTNEEIAAQLRSYYRVELPRAGEERKPPPQQTQLPPAPALPAALHIPETPAPVFEVYEEEERKVEPRRVEQPAAPTYASGIAGDSLSALGAALSRENALAGGMPASHLWVPVEAWEQAVSAIRAGVPQPAAPHYDPLPAAEPPASRGPKLLSGWDDLAFHFVPDAA